ncbi:hypothetical protein L1987_38366 [Smallanthus sonchifolius]|uniref:Uncharacterized protein n=1 Tax=Smallanthus sonchifolius TaxID=185202 RepID=A0ACB9HJ10_9ASTR|nr:hypothetical protein L1987_38366 [Smallanthus sonchifolius]
MHVKETNDELLEDFLFSFGFSSIHRSSAIILLSDLGFRRSFFPLLQKSVHLAHTHTHTHTVTNQVKVEFIIESNNRL